MYIFPKTATFLKATINKKNFCQSQYFSLRSNLKGQMVLKFCPLLGAVKIFMLGGIRACQQLKINNCSIVADHSKLANLPIYRMEDINCHLLEMIIPIQ